jgi:drug/metabolite transporter (DMT)-like permease
MGLLLLGAVILVMGISFMSRPGQYRSAGVVVSIAGALIVVVEMVALATRR